MGERRRGGERDEFGRASMDVGRAEIELARDGDREDAEDGEVDLRRARKAGSANRRLFWKRGLMQPAVDQRLRYDAHRDLWSSSGIRGRRAMSKLSERSPAAASPLWRIR